MASASPSVPSLDAVTLKDLVESLVSVSPLQLDEDLPAAPFKIPLSRVARPQQQQQLSKQCDLWAFVWTSSAVLADILATIISGCRPLNGLRLCEIGSGCGLASIVAAVTPLPVLVAADPPLFRSIVATDAVKDALQLIAFNAKKAATVLASASSSSACTGSSALDLPRLTCAQLDWHRGWSSFAPLDFTATSPLAEAGAAPPPASSSSSSSSLFFDVIVGSDVLFLSSNAKPILQLLKDGWSGWHLGGKLPSDAENDDGCCRRCSCPPFAVLVDPGRPGREELETYASDYGLSLERYDSAGPMMTSLSGSDDGGDDDGLVMRECTVFILTPAGSAGAMLPSCGCVRGVALETTRKAVRAVLKRGSERAAEATAGKKPMFAYTLPSL